MIAVFSFQVHRFAFFQKISCFSGEKPKLTWTANVHHIASPSGCNRVRTAAIERENKSDQLLVACQY
jgi:hypothetical protein